MPTDPRPNVLIFGGLNTAVESLIEHLIPAAPAEPLVSHIRITDKFSIHPPTTYVSKTLRRLFEERKDLVEYRQGNVTNPAVVNASYTDPSPNGRLYTHVIDLQGDVDYEHPAAAQIAHTFSPALIIARASAAQLARFPGSIKAHVRTIPPFYEHVDNKRRYKEDDPKGWGFDAGKGAVRALWWHEAIRAVGSVEDLPLVMLKFAIPYGKGLLGFELTSIILLGLVYKHANDTMKLLWSPKLPKNTINMADIAGLIWTAAEWISTKTRAEANALAGVPILPSNDPSLLTTPPPCANIVPASAGPVIVPVFNAADEGDSTQRSVSEVVGEMFGIKVGFYTGIKGLLARWKMRDMVENINEMHMEHWNAIITSCNPPVLETPLSPYIPLYQLEEHGCALDCEKTRKILQYKFRYPQFDKKAVEDFIEWCRQEGIWPETGTPPTTSASTSGSATATASKAPPSSAVQTSDAALAPASDAKTTSETTLPSASTPTAFAVPAPNSTSHPSSGAGRGLNSAPAPEELATSAPEAVSPSETEPAPEATAMATPTPVA